MREAFFPDDGGAAMQPDRSQNVADAAADDDNEDGDDDDDADIRAPEVSQSLPEPLPQLAGWTPAKRMWKNGFPVTPH